MSCKSYWKQTNKQTSVIRCLLKISFSNTKAPFTRSRFYFISDWGSVYTTPFSFHIGLASCLHENASLCTAMVSLYAFRIHCAFCAALQMKGSPLNVIMRFRIELIPDSTVYTISDWFHVTFRAFSDVTKRIGLVCSRVSRRPIRYEF